MKLFICKKSILLFYTFLSLYLASFSQNNKEASYCGTTISYKFVEHLNGIKPKMEGFENDFMQMKYGKTKTSSKGANSIPIKIHIIRNNNGSGGLNLSELNNAISNLNEIYADAYMNFSIHEDINYINDDQLCHFKKGNEKTIIQNNHVSGIINLYFTNYIENYSDESICGYSNNTENHNIIFIKNSCANNGSSMAHEFGHFFSLLHTHGLNSNGTTTEFVDGSNCDTDGDGICDTPADPGLSSSNINNFCSYVGDEKDVHGDIFSPDTGNIMSYSRKGCRNHFSKQQLARMYAYFKTIENKITSPSKNHELIIDEELSFVKIYPNPVTNGKINLSISQNKSAIKFQIVNFQGQVLSQATLSNNTIDVAYLPSGSYILILQTANSKFVKRFIK